MRLSYALILLPFALAAPVADLAEPVEGPDLAARAERKAPFNQCEKLISYGVDMGNGDIFHSFKCTRDDGTEKWGFNVPAGQPNKLYGSKEESWDAYCNVNECPPSGRSQFKWIAGDWVEV